MKNFTKRLNGTQHEDFTLTLPFELRKKSRLRAQLDNEQGDVALILDRGKVLRDGDYLQSEDGSIVKVIAANESVSSVYSEDIEQLTRVAYHLGNRHVPLQVGKGFVRFQHDHVLDDMVREIGLNVVFEKAPFEPESGAYAQGYGHHHGHSHD